MESGDNARFILDGREYDVPGLDTLTMDERRTMYDYCGLTQEDFVPLEGETDEETQERTQPLTRHPGFLQSLMHIAYQRGNPKLPDGRVKQIIGNTTFVDAVAKFADEDETQEDPTAARSTSEPAPSSPRSSEGLSESSGNGSSITSDEPDATQPPTGASESGMSSPPTPVQTSAS